MRPDQLMGGVMGALIGDACGVPYEFKHHTKLPHSTKIDMVPPSNFKRTWAEIPVGTYSDDGAQLLCLLEVLLTHGVDFEESELKRTLRNWMTRGYMSVDNNTFDIGGQTGAALRTDDVSVLDKPNFNGNGSLMRCLPAALCFTDPTEIAAVAWKQSGVTHPHARSRVCCVIYCLTAYNMQHGKSVMDSFLEAIETATPYAPEEANIVRAYENNEHTGSGYVVDSLWSAVKAVEHSVSYENAIRSSIMYGNDTDTTACIAGGLAGIQYGNEGIPSRWIELLRGKELITPLIYALLEHEANR